MREGNARIIPLTVALPEGKRQMIISGPNTGGKTVALKTAGLLALMAQAGLPVPAEAARLPLFTAIYADIGDALGLGTKSVKVLLFRARKRLGEMLTKKGLAPEVKR